MSQPQPIQSTTKPPPHAHPTHKILTPRLILRSALITDSKASLAIRSNPLNNPFGGVKNPDLNLEGQERVIRKQVRSTEVGENAFLVVVLRDGGEGVDGVRKEEGIEELKVDDGILIGMSGFNGFGVEKVKYDGDENGDSKQVLVGDTGCLIDYRFCRRGFAIETLSAVFEYGFKELGVGVVTLDTFATNRPFREVMRRMGLGEGVVRKEVGDNGEEGEEGEEVVWFRFGGEEWEGVKGGLRGRGKWFL